MKYEKETIQNILNLLNNVEVKGVENCRRIALIYHLLGTTVKEEKENG